MPLAPYEKHHSRETAIFQLGLRFDQQSGIPLVQMNAHRLCLEKNRSEYQEPVRSGLEVRLHEPPRIETFDSLDHPQGAQLPCAGELDDVVSPSRASPSCPECCFSTFAYTARPYDQWSSSQRHNYYAIILFLKRLAGSISVYQRIEAFELFCCLHACDISGWDAHFM
jgi:hypothetical protein